MKILFLSIAAFAAWLTAPLKVYFEIDNDSAETAGAAPTDVGSSHRLPKVFLSTNSFFVLFLLTAVIAAAAPPVLGAVALLTALVLAMALVMHRMPQTNDKFVDKLTALGLSWRRNGVEPTSFA